MPIDHWPLLGLRVRTARLELRLPTEEELAELAPLREVRTASWLGLSYQGRGIGSEMRSAVLHLAFAGLDAAEATTMSFTDNAASLGVSRKLGYRPDGVMRAALHGRAVVSQRLRLTREEWELTDRPKVTISGLEPCLQLFGLDGPDQA